MPDPAFCWKCGASLAQLTLPLLRLDACKQCGAELHVCRQCLFYDVTVAKHCRETIAEEVRDKQRANFCDYFSLNSHAYQPAGSGGTSLTALEELFGAKSRTASLTTHPADQTRTMLEELFKK